MIDYVQHTTPHAKIETRRFKEWAGVKLVPRVLFLFLVSWERLQSRPYNVA